MQLDVESLRTLLAVLEHNGMTPAAEVLGVSQSAVSWKIKRLEERVGKPLLIREGHRFRPTRDCRELLEDARSIVAIHDRAVARLASSELEGTVRVGSNEEVDASRMAAILGRFKRIHPKSTIEFLVNHTENLAAMIDAAEIDLAFIQVDEDHLRPDDVVLWTDDLVWAVCCETPYESGPIPLITFGSHCFYRPLSEPLLKDANIEFNVAFSVATTAGVRGAIAAGLGVGVISSRSLGDDVQRWGRAEGLPPLPAVHQVARAVPGERPAVVEALLEAVVDELQGAAPTPIPVTTG